jgi:N-acetylmuramoyl-L-alanine amidase
MAKRLDTVRDAAKKYAPLVGRSLAKGAGWTARATATAYASHQKTLDALVLSASAATTTAAAVDDYTNLGLVTGALVAATGAGTLKGVEILAARYLPSQEGEPRRHQLLRYGIIATAAATALGLESTVFAAYTSCFDDNCSFLENTRSFIRASAEFGYLSLLSYGALEATQKVRGRLASLVSSGKRVGKNLATATVLAAAALATATATDTLDLAAYDSVTPFDKEGIQTPLDPTKLPSGLEIKHDLFGAYVSLHLQPGQSLYSDVILAHTDFLDHDDVMAAAIAIQHRSVALDLSKDHTSYTVHVVGWNAENIHPEDELKIPLALLSDRYRSAYQKPQLKNPLPPRGVNGKLKGIHVILDAGHGGADPGSGAHGVVENEVAYDIMVRTKKILEEDYGATVHPLVKDKSTGFVPLDKLVDGSNEAVLTSPPYITKKANVAANLRAYKTNDLYHTLLNQGVSSDAIVFMSIHTDAISAHAKGMMLYYPDASLRNSSLTKKGSPYDEFAEVRADPTIEIEADKRGSQDRSYTLAERILAAAPTHAVAVHDQQAIRGRINRGGSYVPAVIRWNPVPAKLLVEAGNCNNSTDAKNLLSAAYRQQVAETLAAGIHAYYVPQNASSTGGGQ